MDEKVSAELENVNENKEDIVNRKNIYLLAGCLGLGIIFDILFYGKPLGVSYPIFILVFYLVFFWNLRKNIMFEFNFGWFLTIPILALSLTYFIFSNVIFKVLNYLGIPVLIIVQTTLITKNNKYLWNTLWFIYDILYSMFIRMFGYISKPFAMVSRLMSRVVRNEKYTIVGRVVVGLMISLPLIMVIISLLSSADEIFAHFTGNFLSVFKNISISQFLLRVIIILFISVVAFSYIWSLTNATKSNDLPRGTQTLNRVWDPVTLITVLLVINAIYLVFTIIQFTYLFGGVNYALPQNFTYAGYARRGFFELIAVTLINLSILLVSINLVRKESKIADKVINVLNSLLIIFTMVMLYSAHYRMSLYEEAYGYTYLRVLTHAFMWFIFALLAVSLYRVWNEKVSLIRWYVAITLVSYLVINYANIDEIIARKNIERYYKTGEIDVFYLTWLSHDAVPLLVGLLDDKNESVAVSIQNSLYNRKERLSSRYYWQSFNISEFRAKSILSKYNLQYKENGSKVRGR